MENDFYLSIYKENVQSVVIKYQINWARRVAAETIIRQAFGLCEMVTSQDIAK